MEILDAEQIRAWDQYTIRNEPIASIDLMERAAAACVNWLLSRFDNKDYFKIFCAKGNNGGDGLAIARLLTDQGKQVSVYIIELGKPGTEDFQNNLQRLHSVTDKIYFIQSSEHFPLISTDDIIIDALFGTGLNKPVEGLYKQIIEHINHSSATVVSIDLPSGMFTDRSGIGNTIVQADHTLTFQCLKSCFLAAENESFFGELDTIDIGLSGDFLSGKNFSKKIIEQDLIRSIYKKRNRFSHKGNFGHCLIAGGSYGKMGAMVLASKACVHMGAGLTTVFIPRAGYSVLQSTVPEAMVFAGESEDHLSGLPEDVEKYSAIGIGPGMGTNPETAKMLSFILRRFSKPVVIDADGLNCISIDPSLLHQLPSRSILTPHPKEFDRLFGNHDSDFSRWDTALNKASSLDIIIILKGHHSMVALPTGQSFFNNNGNPGMAKGGSGDVLTGMITSLLGQGYRPDQAAILGVYLHGLSGDLAAKALSEETMVASDIITFLPQAFKSMS